MNKRPLTVTVLSFVFIAAGVTGLIYHLKDFKPQHPFQYEIIWVTLVRLLAIIGGLFMFLGRNWARWLCLAWLGFHVIVSAFHPLGELVFHAVIFVLITILLLRRDANEYFSVRERSVATET
jgi:membrane-bound ClpP family serine protease